MKGRSYKRAAGMTIVEIVMVILILGIVLAATTQAISQMGLIGSRANSEMKALALAQAYSDEIMSRAYDEFTPTGSVPPCGAPSAAGCTTASYFGPETTVSGSSCLRYNSSGSESTACETVKAVFDDVDDYDGLDEGADSVEAKDLTNSSGEVRQGYEGFRVEVTVDQLSGVSGVKRIMIAVTQPNKQVLDFTVYKVNF